VFDRALRRLFAPAVLVAFLAAAVPASQAATGVLDSSSSATADVWAAGDGAIAGAPARAVSDLIAAGQPDRFLYLGDVYFFGTPREFETNYAPTYGRFASITAPTPGNHDWPNHLVGYDPYWEKALGHPIPPYYGFATGGWQLISLNSELDHSEGSPQLEWLRSRLDRPGTCRIAFWHRPRYSAGLHGDQPDMAPVWDALRGHASLVLAGHDHDMQRFFPIDGITELVSGAGGFSHYEVDFSDTRLAFANDTDYGALRLELGPTVARYTFIDVQGRVLDSGLVRCSRPESPGR
jgi:hypothetical protein